MLHPMSESALEIIARHMSRTIVTRRFDNKGNSLDYSRKCTFEESMNLFRVIYAALLAINFCARTDKNAQKAIMNNAEFTLQRFVPYANTYDSVYNRLRCLLEVWDDNTNDKKLLAHWQYSGIRNFFPDELDYINSWLEYAGEEIMLLDSAEDAKVQIDGMIADADPDDSLPEDLRNPDIMVLLWNTWARTPAN